MDSRVIISVPKEYMKQLNNTGQWIHGLLLERMNPYVTKDVIESHFEKWGVVTFCDVKTECTTGFPRGLGYVGFSREEEADAVEAAGPHTLAGMEVDIRRVISPKTCSVAYVPHKRNGLDETETYAKYVSHRSPTLETSKDITYRSHRRSDARMDSCRPVSPKKSDNMTYVSHRRHSTEISADSTYMPHRRTSFELSHNTTYVPHRRISLKASDDTTHVYNGAVKGAS